MSSPEETPDRYDFNAAESKWQALWERAGLFRTPEDSSRPKLYALDFFPYPSGAGISVGHCRNYVPLDVYARMKRMAGYDVLHPMGWDAFGQPAENAAMRLRVSPRDLVPRYAANYKHQLKLIGISYDWDREINSSDPEYYRWTQYFFLLLYRRGLAYRQTAPINWCPSCRTGIANEEVVANRCWRCESLVEKRPMPQWYFRITAYAERLLDTLDGLAWPEGIRAMQRAWIGKSQGAEVVFGLQGLPETLCVFTTRPDTLWGATFMVLAPEHPLVPDLTTADRSAEVEAYRDRAAALTEIDRQSTERPKTGVFTGSFAVNPVNGEAIPIWIADYVLMGYGTGAIMAVPAHDQRDFEFARKYGIEVRWVYRTPESPPEAEMERAEPAGGSMVDFGTPDRPFPFAGAPNDKETVGAVIRWLEDRRIGHEQVNYRLRDWLISRQRYWGAPIPIIHCDVCGEEPVPEADLPVLLPDLSRYESGLGGESPLANVPEFVNVSCPKCGAPARRETDTMAGFACSSWYFLRFADPHNGSEPFSQEAVRRWLPVDLYVGGAEHAVMHLLYARFWTKVIHDAGLITFDEPFTRLRNQGMLLAHTPGREVVQAEEVEGDEGDAGELIEDWKPLKPDELATFPPEKVQYRWVKMSKSLFNVVTPDAMAEQYGADSLRLFGMFAAPFEDTVKWNESGIDAMAKWVQRLWQVYRDLLPIYTADWRNQPAPSEPGALVLRRSLHATIHKVTGDIEEFRLNTAVAALMGLVNRASAFRNDVATRRPSADEQLAASEFLETLPLLISPAAPHLADTLWEMLGKTGFTLEQPWPACDPAMLILDAITVVVQVNGKLRAQLEAAPGTPDAELQEMALAAERVQPWLEGKTIRRVIVVPDKLVNVVVS
ncbi:MAG: leucine--tRNA ligase [Armatimonadetes bacterium]|nr:leucine--tRNA ligase [Armatimonadota bacterium]MDE2207424.1 leucine--tRNA ligase [Armatimonadota bacterium]